MERFGEVVVIVLGVLALSPFVAFYACKFGAAGIYAARRLFNERDKDDTRAGR